MFSPFPQLVRRLSRGISRFAPLRSSSRWDNIQKIVPALHGKGKDKFKWMEVFAFICSWHSDIQSKHVIAAVWWRLVSSLVLYWQIAIWRRLSTHVEMWNSFKRYVLLLAVFFRNYWVFKMTVPRNRFPTLSMAINTTTERRALISFLCSAERKWVQTSKKWF